MRPIKIHIQVHLAIETGVEWKKRLSVFAWPGQERCSCLLDLPAQHCHLEKVFWLPNSSMGKYFKVREHRFGRTLTFLTGRQTVTILVWVSAALVRKLKKLMRLLRCFEAPRETEHWCSFCGEIMSPNVYCNNNLSQTKHWRKWSVFAFIFKHLSREMVEKDQLLQS